MREAKRAPGEFSAQRAERQRRQMRYDAIRAACEAAQRDGTAQVTVSGRRFDLARGTALDRGPSYYAFLRVKRYGYVFCEVVVKDRGHQYAIFPSLGFLDMPRTRLVERFAAFVDSVIDAETGALLYGTAPSEKEPTS